MAALGVPFFIPAIAANGTVASAFKVNGWIPTSAGAPTGTRRTFYTDAELTTPASNPATLGASGRVFYVNPALSYAFTITSADEGTTYDTIYLPAELDAAGVAALTPLVVSTYAVLTALTSATGLVDAGVYYVLGGDAAGDGAHGMFRYSSASTTTAVAGIVLAIDGGGAGRFFRDVASGPVNLLWATRGNNPGTAQGSLTDCRAQFQAVMDYCYTNKRVLYVPAGRVFAVSKNSGGNYCLADPAISMHFEPAPSDFASQIVPVTGVTSSVDIVYRNPGAGTIDYCEWISVRINPSYSGSPLGKRAFYGAFTSAGTMFKTSFKRCRFDAGNDYSIKMLNTDATNPQGIPFACVIEDCLAMEGIWIEGCADSCDLHRNTIRSTTSSARFGIYLKHVNDAFGVPQKTHIHKNNIDSDNSAIKVMNGGGVQIFDNDIEMSHGTCTAIIDIDGSTSSVIMPLLTGNSVGVFGTAAATSAIRVDNSKFPQIERYKLITAETGGGFTAPTNAILLTSNCSDAYIGPGEIARETNRFTNAINDSGVGTRGLVKALTPTSPFSNVGAGYAGLQMIKALDGTVSVTGWVEGTTTTSPQTITTLPAGFRPLEAYRKYDRGNLGGSVGDALIEVLTSGVLSVSATTGAGRQYPVDMTFPTLSYVIGHD